MRVVVLAGPPCSGKTTLAHQVAQQGDVVLDYDDVARSLGSPAQWIHPEPYRTAAEQELQAQLAMAHAHPTQGTCWLLRTTPRPISRQALAHQWQATVYLLDPGERECRRRARADQTPIRYKSTHRRVVPPVPPVPAMAWGRRRIQPDPWGGRTRPRRGVTRAHVDHRVDQMWITEDQRS